MKNNENKSILEKILLAGIGSMATSAEKAKEILNDLIEKGSLTVEQGKVMNEELQHDIKAKAVEKVVNPLNEKVELYTAEIIKSLNDEELASLKAKVLQAESERQDKTAE